MWPACDPALPEERIDRGKLTLAAGGWRLAANMPSSMVAPLGGTPCQTRPVFHSSSLTVTRVISRTAPLVARPTI
ncbi:MAG: hypothetical protein ABSF03_30410 [Streptosporangiaceae bacterium]